MARWRKKTLEQMTERITQLGLSNCPICDSGTMTVLRYPVIHWIGGTGKEPQDPVDPVPNILFMVQIQCSLCGYAMLFNSEQLSEHDEKSLITGMTDAEEAAWEAQQG